MVDVKDYFKGKKITVMGLGLLGRGLGDAQYLAEAGAELIVTDLKTAAELEDSAAQLRPYQNVELVLGEHRLEDFEDRDFILVAAGVPKDSEYLAHARANNVPLKMSAALLAELTTVPMIGVTGTRGKSTVTQLIQYTLTQVGQRAVLGGNTRGVSNLQLLKNIETTDVLVMELDSWQLQGFGWIERSPHIAVFTNFMEDHLNYYPDMEAYFADKANIYTHQKTGDVLVAGKAVAEEWIATHPAPYGVVVSESLPEDWSLLIPGDHNRANAALAVAALQAYGVTEAAIKTAVTSFTGVEGRLQYLKAVNEVEIYNDNNATTPQAVVAGLRALDKGRQNIILIAGGADKGIDIAPLALAITECCKQVILTPGNGTDRLVELLHGGTVGVSVVENLEVAVAAARRAAAPGDIILFSPAFASFAQFKNEYDRNDQFLELVENLV